MGGVGVAEGGTLGAVGEGEPKIELKSIEALGLGETGGLIGLALGLIGTEAVGLGVGAEVGLGVGVGATLGLICGVAIGRGVGKGAGVGVPKSVLRSGVLVATGLGGASLDLQPFSTSDIEGSGGVLANSVRTSSCSKLAALAIINKASRRVTSFLPRNLPSP